MGLRSKLPGLTKNEFWHDWDLPDTQNAILFARFNEDENDDIWRKPKPEPFTAISRPVR